MFYGREQARQMRSKSDRNADIYNRVVAGMTMKEVGSLYGITSQRVAQITGLVGSKAERRVVGSNALERIKAGESYSAVARDLGINQSSLANWSTRKGVKKIFKSDVHGTMARYNNRGCRCDACRRANTLYRRD